LSKKYLIKGIEIPLTWVRLHGNNAAFDVKKSIIGLSNIYGYVLNNFFESSSLQELKKVQKTIEELINNYINNADKEDLVEGKDTSLVLNISLKEKIKSFFKKFLCKINPLYRKVAVCKDTLDGLNIRFNNFFIRNEEVSRDYINNLNKLDNKMDDLFIRNEELFKTISKNWKENTQLQEDVKRLKNIIYPEQNNSLINLNGEKIKFLKHLKSKVLEFNLTNRDFFIEMKKYIIKSNILIDIGCGIRPETFFEPSVHICIEPFDQYRNIAKSYFPNRSNAIFIKSDALGGLKNFDDNSVDSIFMIDLIEHLEKEDGLKLIKEADRVARKQIVIFTPLGFYPMFYKKNDKDAWGLNGANVQEHKSGWTPEDFDNSWDFYICKNCHEAFLPEEKAINKKYSAMMAIKTKKFDGFPEVEETPDFVKNLYKERIEK